MSGTKKQRECFQNQVSFIFYTTFPKSAFYVFERSVCGYAQIELYLIYQCNVNIIVKFIREVPRMGFFCPVRTFPFGQLFNVSVNIPNKVIKKKKKVKSDIAEKTG